MGYTSIIEVGGYRFERDGELIGGSVTHRISGKKKKHASSASFEIDDPQLTFINGSCPLPTKDTKIPVEVWFGEGLLPTKIFSGWLSGISVRARQQTLVLDAVDKTKNARRRRVVRNLTDLSVEAMLGELAADSELMLDLTGASLGDVVFAQRLLHGESAFEVIADVLDGLGHRMFVLGDTLYVTADGEAPAFTLPTLTLAYGSNIVDVDFDIAERTGKLAANVFDFDGTEIQADPDGQAAIDRPVTLDRLGMTHAYNAQPSYTSQGVEKAKAAQAKAKRVFEASISLPYPAPELQPDSTVLLTGYGARLSGIYVIDEVSHDIGDGTTSMSAFNGGAD